MVLSKNQLVFLNLPKLNGQLTQLGKKWHLLQFFEEVGVSHLSIEGIENVEYLCFINPTFGIKATFTGPSSVYPILRQRQAFASLGVQVRRHFVNTIIQPLIKDWSTRDGQFIEQDKSLPIYNLICLDLSDANSRCENLNCWSWKQEPCL